MAPFCSMENSTKFSNKNSLEMSRIFVIADTTTTDELLFMVKQKLPISGIYVRAVHPSQKIADELRKLRLKEVIVDVKIYLRTALYLMLSGVAYRIRMDFVDEVEEKVVRCARNFLRIYTPVTCTIICSGVTSPQFQEVLRTSFPHITFE